jgi:hypothetical protein
MLFACSFKKDDKKEQCDQEIAFKAASEWFFILTE